MDPHINPQSGVWDDNYYENTGKYLAGDGSSASSVPTFSFDYEGEAKKAYGELGTYYMRILEESKGDMNKALSRLTEDYDRGLRYKKEDYQTANKTIDIQERNAKESAIANANARGIYQKSIFDPFGGRGLADTVMSKALEPVTLARNENEQSLQRYKEGSDIEKGRTETDIKETQSRYEADLEQQRRKESASMAESRANRAFSQWQAKLYGV